MVGCMVLIYTICAVLENIHVTPPPTEGIGNSRGGEEEEGEGGGGAQRLKKLKESIV